MHMDAFSSLPAALHMPLEMQLSELSKHIQAVQLCCITFHFTARLSWRESDRKGTLLATSGTGRI